MSTQLCPRISERLDPNTKPKFLVWHITNQPTGSFAFIHIAGTLEYVKERVSKLARDREFMESLTDDDRYWIECALIEDTKNHPDLQ